MGKKKKQTFPSKKKSQSRLTVNCSVTARNLRKEDLGGVIFGCKYNTMGECYSQQLFGLPAPHIAYIRNIDPGLTLFLFNYSDRTLHGIFEAASHGAMNINPHGWTADGWGSTSYPAQVRVQNRMQCQPLTEDQFKPVIDKNYYKSKHFWFELDKAQTNKLISMFSSSPTTLSNTCSQNIAKQGSSWVAPDWEVERQPQQAPIRKETTEACKQHFVSNTSISVPLNSWSSLFTRKEDKATEAPALKVDFSHPNKVREFSGDVGCLGQETQHCGGWANEVVNPLHAYNENTDCWENEVVNPFHAYDEDTDDWENEVVNPLHAYNENNVGSANEVMNPLHPYENTEWDDGWAIEEANPPHSNGDGEIEHLDSWTNEKVNTLHAYNEDREVQHWDGEWTNEDANPSHASWGITSLDIESKTLEANVNNDSTEVQQEEESEKNGGCPRVSSVTNEMNAGQNHGDDAGDNCVSEGSSQSVIVELMQQMDGLKASESNLVQKISWLEQELVESRMLIQKLEGRFTKLESRVA